MTRAPFIRRLALLAGSLALMVAGTTDIRALRRYQETVVVSDAFTRRVDAERVLPRHRGDAERCVRLPLRLGRAGGSVLILGGVHPYEPASAMTAYVVMENIAVAKGRVFVIPRANPSASTLGMLGNAYPPFFHVKTGWGVKKYRIGDRETHPLDQWPDPFTAVHYPSTQNLAYQDSRNLNRMFPGTPGRQPDGAHGLRDQRADSPREDRHDDRRPRGVARLPGGQHLRLSPARRRDVHDGLDGAVGRAVPDEDRDVADSRCAG